MSKEKLKIENCGNVFVFILGREQKIALIELESVLRRFDVCFDILSLQDNIAIIKTEKASNFQPLAARLMENLGGTVKIYEIIQNSEVKNQNYGIESLLLDKLLENKSGGTLNFGISDYSNTFSGRELKKLGIGIKKEARKKRPVRFVEGKGTELSSATSYHKIYMTGGEEFGIFNANLKFNLNSKLKIENYHKNDNYLLGRLVATTNPDEWSERDYGKPAGDKYSGMMPPKLARMMVNMALGQVISNSQETITSKINNNQYLINDELKNKRTEEQKNECYSELVEGSQHRASGSINNGENPELRIKNSADQISGQKNKKTEEQRNIENSHIEHSLKIENCKIENLHNVVVLDPFCGSGNILMEAVLLGCEVIGSDISEKAVEDTRANLIWLSQNSKFKIQNLKFNLNSKLKIENFVFKADSTSADFIRELKNRRTKEQKNIVVVTEPYLGKPKKQKVERKKAKGEIEELKALYLSFFKNLKSIIYNSSFIIHSVCFVFPVIETLDAGEISLYNECVDELHQMGYNTTRTLRYGRDYQVTKRLVAVFNIQ